MNISKGKGLLKNIHAYDNVDDILIWKIVNKDIPVLLIEAKTVLNEN